MLVGARVEGQEITPSLNKLVKESWYFPNTYAETGGGNTADAEFVVNTGLYPPPNGQAAAVAYVDRELPGLPRMLRAQGYKAITFHGNDARYWNRTQLYPALGFNKFYDKSFFANRDVIWLGPSDEVLFEDGLGVIEGLAKKKQPFYAQFVTLSSHPGYSAIPQNRRPLKVPEKYYNSFTGNYTSSESYADYALGKFIDNLKSSGLWDDSVVVIYGDHTAFLNLKNGNDRKYVATFLERRANFSDRQRVPLLIHVPGQKKGKRVETTASQVDIMPTVADLVGIDLSGQPHLGRSVFVNSPELAVFRSYFPGGSFVASGTIFMPGLSFADGTAVKVSDGSPAAPGSVTQQHYDRTQQLDTLSDSWVRSLPRRANVGDNNDAFIPGVTPKDQLEEKLKNGTKK
jgi:phosphoglycerol transferase MdoB-like AlkP superfamily enzyme